MLRYLTWVLEKPMIVQCSYFVPNPVMVMVGVVVVVNAVITIAIRLRSDYDRHIACACFHSTRAKNEHVSFSQCCDLETKVSWLECTRRDQGLVTRVHSTRPRSRDSGALDKTKVSWLGCTRVHFSKVSVLVSRPGYQGLGLGLE